MERVHGRSIQYLWVYDGFSSEREIGGKRTSDKGRQGPSGTWSMARAESVSIAITAGSRFLYSH